MSNQKYDMKKIEKNSIFLDQWKEKMREHLYSIYGDNIDEKVLEKVLSEQIRSRLQLPEVELDNNYVGERKTSNLLSLVDWVIERKPIIAGNGTFYKNQHEAMNPVAVMLQEFLANRKRLKKEMFKVVDVSSALYKDLDRGQLNEKISANSFYGASGMSRSPFYSQWSGPATTGSAQSIISTTETFFEGFMACNYKFISFNECMTFMNDIKNTDYSLHKWIKRISVIELKYHLEECFYDDIYNEGIDRLLDKFISNLTEEERTKIYYKFNLLKFIENHSIVINLFRCVFENVNNNKYAETIYDVPSSFIVACKEKDDKKIISEYEKYVNHEFFMDPNEPPKSIEEPLKEINEYLMTYVYMPMMMFDRIHRLKYFNRKVVCIVDTDSNILTLDAWTTFCKEKILTSDYNRSYENNKFIMVNTIAYFLQNAIGDVLHNYAKHSNIPEDHRHYFTMKNEFYFNKLVVGRKKKRYMASIKLREGTYIKSFKPDTKGFDYKKATTSELAKERFDNIVRYRILEHECVDIPGIMSDLKAFEDEIRENLLGGDKKYLPLGSAKDIDAYADPYSQQSVRGVIAWNYLHPDKQISLPSKVTLLKLDILTDSDIADMETEYPNEYKIITEKIFNSKIKALADKKLQVLAIPLNEDIPEWCKKYIDYNTVINNIISQFKGVCDSFGIEYPIVGKTRNNVNRKTAKFSNIVRF